LQRKIRINGDLRGTPKVRVIGPDGAPLGDMTVAEALRAAMKAGLDLVEVNPSADPPVCKLLDFSQYTYEGLKQRAQARREARDDEDDD
jgi:translation initiation factor IF-3